MFGSIISGFGDVIVLVLFFSFAIFVHEFGHFIAAVKLGFKVNVFSIGFGPALFKWEKNGITYKFSVVPFGGYVSLPQLDPSGMEKIQGENGEEVDQEVEDIAAWKKIIVAIAGPLGNIVLAVILAFVIYLVPTKGLEDKKSECLVGYVDEQSPAYEAGIKKGDIILAVNGEKVNSWYDMSMFSLLSQTTTAVVRVESEGIETDLNVPLTKTGMGEYLLMGLAPEAVCVVGEAFEGGSAAEAGMQGGDIIKSFNGILIDDGNVFIDLVAERPDMETDIVVIRGDEEVAMMVTPKYDKTLDRAVIGISMGTIGQQSMPWMMYKKPMDQLKGDSGSILRILRALVNPKESGKAAKGLGGPVMILVTLWYAIQESFLNAVGFLRFLNVNLAILNLLPIPVLDGGHIVFALYEIIFRRKPSQKFVNVVVNFFAILLICAFIMLMFRDTFRIKKAFFPSKHSEKAPVEQIEGE
ncbi:MAG: RIP metalloprotease RseP [Kiritimatiellae bacterium]|jgi:regulator of sigma E protease|nr:RIP metalloprotease RseP [Kiritimatiellia bacterium]